MSPRFTGPILLAALGLATPAAFAHFSGSAAPHLHASDLAGVAAVVALTIGAGWLDRRRARARRERDARRAGADTGCSRDAAR